MTLNQSLAAEGPAVSSLGKEVGRPGLVDLTPPLSASAFHDAHWSAGEPFLSRANPALVRAVRSIKGLADVNALIARYKGDVSLFGPDSSRTTVPPRSAAFFLERGYNLFFVRVDESLPEARAFFQEVAAELGFGPRQVRVEAFCGRPGGVSSRHYDNDINFQILLDGTKDWVLERNRHIQNPLNSHHPTLDPHGAWAGFNEEAYAIASTLPTAFDPTKSHRLRAEAGTVLFLPRAYWHETRSLEDTWAVNLVIKGVTWADALGRAVAQRIERDARFRRYCDGHGERVVFPAASDDRRALFDALKSAAAAAVAAMMEDDVALSAEGDRFYSWSPSAGARLVRCREGSWELAAPPAHALALDEETRPIAERLCAFTCPFQWKHARAALPGARARTIYRLVEALLARRLLRSESPG